MSAYEDFKENIRAGAFVRASDTVQIIRSEQGADKDAWIFDFRAIMLQPATLDRYADIFWEKYGSQYPFQVGGLETASIPLIAAIVMKSVERKTPVNGFYIRKSRKRQGLTKQIEGALTRDPIILVDDLTNSGQTFDKQIKILANLGARVNDIFVLLSFRAPDAYTFMTKAGVRFESLFTLKDFGLPLLEKSADSPGDPFVERWRYAAPAPGHHVIVQKSAPVLFKDLVLFGCDDGFFRALEQESGALRWQYKIGKHPLGKAILSSPIIRNGIVFFGAYDGCVYALDARTGSKKWIYAESDWVGSSPDIDDTHGLVFVGTEYGLLGKRGGIVALDIKNGAEVWHARHRELTHGSPIYIKEENIVVIGSNDGASYAYNATSGDLMWRHQTGGDIKTRPAYDKKRNEVLVTSLDGSLYALAARTGIPRFAFETLGIYSIPLIDGDTAYVSSLDKNLYAIDLSSGEKKWSFETRGRIFASPILCDGSLWIGSNDGRLYELDPARGTLRNFFQTTERVVNAIAYNSTSKRFFVPTSANELYCIERNPRQ